MAKPTNSSMRLTKGHIEEVRLALNAERRRHGGPPPPEGTIRAVAWLVVAERQYCSVLRANRVPQYARAVVRRIHDAADRHR
jgi:hypothetical protein